MINELILMGRVVAPPPELKYWESGGGKIVPITKLQINTAKDTHEICVFGDTAERVFDEIDVGDLILVKGKIKSRIEDRKKLIEIYARTVEKIKED